jgi:cytochrome c-type biogenesis protein
MPGVEELSEALARAIEGSSVLAPFAAFLGGALTALNPCVLVMVPLMVGLAAGVTGSAASELDPNLRIWRRTLALSLLFVAGFALELTLLFTLAAAFATRLQAAWWKYVLVAICALVGAHLLGLLSIPAIPVRRSTSRVAGGLAAVVLGFLFGVISLPCTGPVLLLLMAMVPQVGPARAGILLFLYGLGHSLLILVAGTSVGAAAAMAGSERLQLGARRLRQAGGAMVLAGGAWLLLH